MLRAAVNHPGAVQPLQPEIRISVQEHHLEGLTLHQLRASPLQKYVIAHSGPESGTRPGQRRSRGQRGIGEGSCRGPRAPA